MRFGQALESALDKCVQPKGKGKNVKPLSEARRNHEINKTLEQWLGISTRKYRDPMSQVIK